MSLPEQSTKKCKLMCVELCIEVTEDMTPNILTPLIRNAFKDMGIIDGYGIVCNHKDYEDKDQINCVVVKGF